MGVLVDQSVDKVLLGEGQLVPGWERGVMGACQGERRQVLVSTELAYGSKGLYRRIPPLASLFLEIDVLTVEKNI